MKPQRRSTTPGQHVPVLLFEVIDALRPGQGDVVVDCTLGYGGHSAAMLQKVGPTGKLIAFDLDGSMIPNAEAAVQAVGHPYALKHSNFAGISAGMAEENVFEANVILADLGMSSMQVDDPGRGFSFMREGPLDMRMDQSRGRTAADLLQTLSAEELAQGFQEYGDEPEAMKIAQGIVERRAQPLQTTKELMELIMQVAPVKVNQNPRKGEPSPRQQQIRPTARIFQALRIMVNRELSNLNELLRVAPYILAPGGRIGIISFHSGEDRLVKLAFKEGQRQGIYSHITEDPIRSGYIERYNNPRARSAKLRVATKAT